jgi:citrate lyase beta subunit
MKAPRKYFDPLAIGAPRPLLELPSRLERMIHFVPPHNEKMRAKAAELVGQVDVVLGNLEDAIPIESKQAARDGLIAMAKATDFGSTGLWARVNALNSPWLIDDLTRLVGEIGDKLDVVMVPKVEGEWDIHFIDQYLALLEARNGLKRPILVHAILETAQGVNNVEAIAAASPRLETIIFGPADFMASINMRSLVVGEQPPGYPADAYHYVLMRILIAARAHGLQAIDGPYLQVRNLDGFRAVARRAAALGFDGKWVLHPDQIAAANEIFSPAQEDYDHAELILDAYDWSVSAAGGAKGSAMLGDEMIDEASRKMALVIAAKGRDAGLARTSVFEPPQE